MRFIAILVRRLIKSWLWFFFPVMGLSLWALFYGWGFSFGTVLAAIFLILMMLVAAFLAWFWLAFFKAVADGAKAPAQPAAQGPDVHKPAP